MNVAKQALWLFITLIILAFSGWYFANLNPVIKLDNDTLSTTVDTTVSELIVRRFNSDGLLLNCLTSPLMHHIPKGDVHLFEMPHIVISQADQPAWDITALSAKSVGGGKRITFMKHVVVHQQPGDNTQESTLKTEEVTYFPKEKKASTDLFVTYEQPGNFLESTGMIAYLDEKRVELLHKARGHYAPDKG